MISSDPGPAGARPVTSASPRSVAELAASGGWKVERGDFGRWVLAEHQIERGAQRWLVGLTPVSQEITALVLWCDDVLVDHARGTESDMCALAHHLLIDIAEGRQRGDATGGTAAWRSD